MATDPDAQGSVADDGRVRRLYGSILSRRPLPIRFAAGEARPGFVQRIVHWWRYGSYHPDEDLLGVVDAAVDSLTVQIKSAEGLLTGSRREKLDRIRLELNAELVDDVPELAVLLGIEAKINALYPTAVQRRRAWMIQERFRRVAPGQAASYWESVRGETLLAEDHDDRIGRADEAVARATAAQSAAVAAAAAAEAALSKATEDHGAGSAEEAEATAARDSAAAAAAASDWSVAEARLQRELVHARCDLERLQARLRGAERAAREQTGGTGAAGIVETTQSELADAQTKVDNAAAAVEAHAETRPASLPADAGDAAGSDSRNRVASGIDAEAQTLLGYIHSAYLMGIARERAVRDLMRWLMMRFWSANIVLLVLLLAAWAVLGVLDQGEYVVLILGLFAIAAVGRIGATMSVVQRLQGAISSNVLANDPVQELTRLRTGKNGINLALFSGGVFALLTYAFFASGIPASLGFDDGAAPAIGRIQDDALAQAQRQFTTENLARVTREFQEQEDRLRELAAARSGASGADLERIEAQLREAEAALEQRRAALTAAAVAVSPAAEQQGGPVEESAPGAAEEGAGADGNESTGNVSDGNASDAANDVAAADSAADNVQSVNVQAGGEDGENASASEPGGNDQGGGDGKPAASAPAAPAAAAPRRSGDQCNAKEPCDPFVRLALALGFDAREDLFKMLIWAFLAGFAERLVPDALDTISTRARRRRRADGAAGDETA